MPGRTLMTLLGHQPSDRSQPLFWNRYVEEPSDPGGLGTSTKERNATRRDRLLATLSGLDVASWERAGAGPVPGEYEASHLPAVAA